MLSDAPRDAERALAQLARLSLLTEALAKARTPEELATIVVENGEEALGATVSSFVRWDGTELVRLAVRGISPEQAKAWERFPIDLGSPSATALRTGQAMWIESAETYEATFTTSISPERVHAACAIPLVLGEKRTGVIVFLFGAPRTFSQAERSFMETFARQAAIALERTDGHVRELDYQRRLEALAAAERRARREADLASRAKDEFLATVSHELRTPLNAILGWARMLTTAELDEEKTRRAIETIDRNAVAMAQLVEDLLDISRIISGKLRLEVRPVDLAHTLEAAIESIRPAASKKQLHLGTNLASDLAPLSGDEARLQQIFWNLLSNAVKFTPPGGTIDVRLRAVDGGVEVAVHDSGQGIGADFLPFVFEPFRQEDASYTRPHGGLGLGLAITKELVELHGGRIEVTSDGVGAGSTFLVRLPAAAGP